MNYKFDDYHFTVHQGGGKKTAWNFVKKFKKEEKGKILNLVCYQLNVNYYTD